jgi:pimeloyl-ACP methyl ester carboxylesterase
MERRIEISTDRKRNLIGCLNHADYKYLVILCHGYTSNKDFNAFRRMSLLLNQRKLSAFRFDFSGAGESEGPKSMSLKRQVEDLENVIGYFKQYRKIILVGHSLGILPVLNCCTARSVEAIVSINGFFDGKIKLPKFFRAYAGLKLAGWFVPRIREEFRYFHQTLEPARIVKPMLLITTPNDEILDYRQSKYWSEGLHCPKKLVELLLSGHGINQTEDVELVSDTIIRWMGETIWESSITE